MALKRGAGQYILFVKPKSNRVLWGSGGVFDSIQQVIDHGDKQIEDRDARIAVIMIGPPRGEYTRGYQVLRNSHSSIAITMDIYWHWIPGEGRAGLEAALPGPEEAESSAVPNLHIFAYKKGATQISI